ncbi:patatin-like phospholipase family protein [Lederbergia lenta]|uniref:Phospholipase n=1 Tax=Lederbergia lenta TaxID=1467 RepID=A0A2X4VKR2_LEDLE|nr:patatin-like phospholipase family protein [Lederbergia lenta]MCM3112690.1 patatin-like phospholipase family protein [Lederbergia lenta]MEC2323729.1 patatin-like phospholipase family protein [Lederbergia lenta]SQI51553.1 phospholipase [Lederbergia lenta]
MKRTGLSLGGGSLRGVAHIGALKELINNNIEITHIAGTSAGSVVGGLFACGLDPEMMKSVVHDISIRRHIDIGFNRKGWIKGDRIYNTLLKLTDGKHFSDLDIPFAVICVDLISGEMVVIKSGEVALAIRASIAIPGLFSPIEIGNKLLVDGYILNNNPADIVRGMGAEKVTSVRVRSSNPHYPSNLISVLNRYIDIASQKNTDRCLEQHADVLIDIDLHDIGRFETKSLYKSIELGQEEARKVLLNRELYESSDNIIYMDQWLRKVR